MHLAARPRCAEVAEPLRDAAALPADFSCQPHLGITNSVLRVSVTGPARSRCVAIRSCSGAPSFPLTRRNPSSSSVASVTACDDLHARLFKPRKGHVQLLGWARLTREDGQLGLRRRAVRLSRGRLHRMSPLLGRATQAIAALRGLCSRLSALSLARVVLQVVHLGRPSRLQSRRFVSRTPPLLRSALSYGS